MVFLEYRDRARVLFFCPTEKLVEQQYKELDKWFPDINTEWLVGGDAEEKPHIHELILTKTERGTPLCQVLKILAYFPPIFSLTC